MGGARRNCGKSFSTCDMQKRGDTLHNTKYGFIQLSQQIVVSETVNVTHGFHNPYPSITMFLIEELKSYDPFAMIGVMANLRFNSSEPVKA